MEAWTHTRYQRPALRIASAEFGPAGQLQIVSPKGSFDVTIDGPLEGVDAARLTRLLRDLAMPGASPWSQLDDDDRVHGIAYEVVRQLDEFGLVYDAGPTPEVDDDGCAAVAATAAHALVAALAGRRTAASVVRGVLLEADQQVATLGEENDVPADLRVAPAGIAYWDDNFHVQVIKLQLRYLRRAQPRLLLTLRTLLARTAAQLAPAAVQAADPVAALVHHLDVLFDADLYDGAGTPSYLRCLHELLLLAVAEPGPRLCCARLGATFDQAERGANFMLRMEDLAAAGLRTLGRNRILDVVADAGVDAQRWAARGLAIEEYHVTRRFVEMITPALAKRLKPELRTRLFRYYQEEFGHEVFEQKTCESLGVEPDELHASAPLPLLLAYVDAFTQIAEADPAGYFASIMITEGLLGQEHPFHQNFEKAFEEPGSETGDYSDVSKQHTLLNIELNHSSLSRLLFADAARLSPQAQRRAAEHMLFLLELNFRGLDQLSDWYTTHKGMHRVG